ncbi:MAG: c-type cytochrome [Planctomycetaceae bacterium]|nr:c-type cytochrome [Planctomycetaceae bacterium]
MSRQLLGGLALCAALAAPLTIKAFSARPPAPKPIDVSAAEAGKALFLHEFTANDPLCPNGDGLGPVFNAKSCVACHRQGGVGGSGPQDANVHAFIARIITCGNDGIVRANTQKSGLIHNAATRPDFRETEEILKATSPNLDIHVTERKTPALFGAKLIDEITDREILANERAQQLRRGMAVEGSDRVPLGRAVRLVGNRIGRFGWKGQTASLSDFVQAACANELGLGNPNQAQAQSFAKAGYTAPGFDLSLEQCDQMTAFIQSLPRPEELAPPDVSSADVERGRALFSKVGCAECHQPDVGRVTGIYSDLLLHDMGQTLSAGGSYNDPPIPDPDEFVSAPAKQSEWRTPPLWGVADAAPYMHDGRAATLEEAIRAHTGQGDPARTAFTQLALEEQKQLVLFLKSLRAPQPR